jgi:hypothetical protein
MEPAGSAVMENRKGCPPISSTVTRPGGWRNVGGMFAVAC